jgi:hypothetical protein
MVLAVLPLLLDRLSEHRLKAVALTNVYPTFNATVLRVGRD